MRYYETVEKVVKVKEPRSIQCNECGEFFEPSYADSTQQFNLRFGYGSKFGNQKPWIFEMCESCILKLIKGFKVVPENFMSDASIISACDNNHELHQMVFEQWQQTGEWNWEDEDPYKDFYAEESKTNEDFDEEIEVFYREQSTTNLTLVK